MPFLAPHHKVWLTHTAQVPWSNAANIGERRSWTQSEFCTWQNSLRGQDPPKCISVPAQETAKHRAKFGWPPLSYVGAVIKPTCETRWNLLGCPKLGNQSQPLVGQSSPYCEDMWRRGHVEEILLFNQFLQLSIHASVAELEPDKVVWWCADGRFLHPVFSVSRMQHISDLHSKFALRPHHMWKYGRHPICDWGE